jgi:hypothetical protein
VRLEELGQLKNPMTWGFESTTFRIVPWNLNQLRYRVTLLERLKERKMDMVFGTWNVNVPKGQAH